MGYTTDFEGSFKLSRPTTVKEFNYINTFSETRRMKRDVNKLMEKFKGEFGHPTRPDNPYGKDGEFFVGGTGWAGQDQDETIIDYNTAPGQVGFEPNTDFTERWNESQRRIKSGECQPGLWCQWILNDKEQLQWDGNEKFYNYIEWLKYLINNFFEEWGIKLNGEVTWIGEDSNDRGKIVIEDNKVRIFEMEMTYKEI
jgi:hypothetical protein